MKKSRIKTSTPSKVVDWLRTADAEEISEALLAVDEAKAALVVAALIGKTEAEARRMLDAVGREFEEDPVGTFARGVIGTMSRLSRGK